MHDDPGTPGPRPPVLRPLSLRSILLGGLTLVLATVAVVWLLLERGTDATQLDAIRTGGTLLVGAGGGVALWLAARRQRSTELDVLQKYEAHELAERTAHLNHAHQVRVADDAREDATERRITELYTRAADQLGSDRAPVRLAGLYSLERLAQANPEHRQTIVNVLCAYLRMPYTPAHGDTETTDPDHQHQVQEREVRLTAQRILATHLDASQYGDQPAPTFWADMDLDLSGATLVDFLLMNCQMRTCRFAHTTFINAAFTGSRFTGTAWFDHATFDGVAGFTMVKFDRTPTFNNATFDAEAHFNEACFNGVSFADARFNRATVFNEADFGKAGIFSSATFRGGATFDKARFHGHAMFALARFGDFVTFDDTEFAQTPDVFNTSFEQGWPQEFERFRQDII